MLTVSNGLTLTRRRRRTPGDVGTLDKGEGGSRGGYLSDAVAILEGLAKAKDGTAEGRWNEGERYRTEVRSARGTIGVLVQILPIFSRFCFSSLMVTRVVWPWGAGNYRSRPRAWCDSFVDLVRRRVEYTRPVSQLHADLNQLHEYKIRELRSGIVGDQ